MSRRAWLVFAVVSVLWGLPYFFIKVAVEELPPVFVAWSRIALAAAILLPIAWRQGALRGLGERRTTLIVFACVELVAPFTLIPVGERHISSSLAAILIAAVPLTVAMMAMRVAPEERATGLRLVGLFVGLVGVIAMLGIDVAGNPDELVGALCILGATVGYAAGPLIVARRLSDLPPIGPIAASLGIATLILAPVAAITPPHGSPSPAAIGSVVVLGIVCTAVALVLFFFLNVEVGPAKATIITYVNPVVAVGLGVAFLGEDLGAATVVGLLLILAGSYLSTGGRPPAMRRQGAPSRRSAVAARLRKAEGAAPMRRVPAGRAVSP